MSRQSKVINFLAITFSIFTIFITQRTVIERIPAEDPHARDNKNQIEIQTNNVSESEFAATEKMDIEKLKLEAFKICQRRYQEPVIKPVPQLDPPKEGGPEAEGMVYQEELAVKTKNFLDRDGFYLSPRPRAAVNSLGMGVYVDDDNSGIYKRKTWNDADPDYSSPLIQPPILKKDIPPAGRVLTELIYGHRSPKGDYPQLFDIRSSAYIRFAGYPPQITGASLRLGAHNIFGKTNDGETKENFPIIKTIFTSVKNSKTSNALILLDSPKFCGAISMDMNEGENADIVIDSYWYTREDFNWQKEPHTGLAAYSSMSWKTEKHTPERISDEAHDSDTLTIKYDNGSQQKITLDPPDKKLRIRDLTQQTGQIAKEWTLANEDRNPAHYADFLPALGNTNYNFRASYKVEILDSNIKTGVSLYEQTADGEYGDNLVAVSTIRQDIKKSKSADDFVRFKYKTTSFFP